MTRPLEGLRVVDFTWVRAGPWAARWLAVLGADVIKVEWPDPGIGWSTGRVVRNVPGMGSIPPNVEPSMNSDGHFNDMHAMKRSITLNLRTPRGLELAKKLVAQSDVVIENFSAGVLKSWGLSFEEMQAIKPDIVYVSMAGFGHTGPRAEYQTMGPSVQALSGLTFVSGLPDKPPAGWGWSYMDDTGGMYGIIGVLNALQHRASTGRGQHVDLSQVGAAMTLLGPALLDLTVNERGSRREGYPPGNRSVWPGTPKVDNYRGPISAPHNIYRTLGGGHNDWAAIVCETDEQWQSLKRVMGSPAWADARFDTLDGRLEHQEEMDEQIQAWTEPLEKYALADMCQAAGVPAMPVQSSEDRVEHDPQLRARGMYEHASHPVLGSWPLQQSPWHMSETPTIPIERGAPICGEHNIEILCGMLGVSLDELRSGYEDNTFWPKSVELQPYLLEALEGEKVS